MNTKVFILFAILLTLPFLAVASEEAPPAEKKKLERKTDSPVAIIAELPLVKQWMKWKAEHKDDSDFDIWGEAITSIDGVKCSEVSVGEIFKNQSHVWKRFCVKQSDYTVWVEKDVPVKEKTSDETKKIILPKDAQADVVTDTDASSETSFIPYQKWVDECKPTNNSPGTC